MAVENKVSIYGQIRKIKKKPVKSIKQGGGGMYVSMAVMVSRRRRAGFGVINGANRIDVVTVLFRSARLVDRLLDPAHPVRENDMIYIYGVFCTVPVRRRWLCPNCGEENFLDGTATFIHPLVFKVQETPENLGVDEITRPMAFDMIREMDEISNRIKIMGNLCRDPAIYRSENGVSVCTYQIATNRCVHLMEDAPQIMTDYPWVRSLGNIAESDYRHLKTGSLVYIDGSIQSRRMYKRSLQCAYCGEWTRLMDNDGTMDIVPFEVEYLRNYKTDPEGQMPEDCAQEAFPEDTDDYEITG